MQALLVGEAWGRSEAQMQHPLVGASGRELALEIAQAGFAPYITMTCRKCKRETEVVVPRCQHCNEFLWPNEFTLMDYWKRLKSDYGIHVTNVFNMQPPNNDLGFFFGTEVETEMPPWYRPKSSPHIKNIHFHHVKRLWREIEEAKPNLIVAMGNAACWALLGQTKITDLRGTINWSDRLKVKVLPTFHPAAVMRNVASRPTVLADWTKAAREKIFPHLQRPTRHITIPSPDSEGLHEIKEWLARPATSYANDIETVRGQISIVGLARSRSDSLVIPFRDCHTKNGKIIDVGKIARSINRVGGINYWPTLELEYAAWQLVIQAEATSIPKIFQNGLYDLSYFTSMGIKVNNALHDTMLWHHSMYPELRKSLGHLGSIYCDEIAWKQMSKAGGEGDSNKRDE
jgi:uracil-DNA glycosylase